MSNDPNNQTRIGHIQQSKDLQHQVRAVVQRLNDLTELLRSQRELLQQRGMNLPSGSLDGLRTMRARMDQLATKLFNSNAELRQLRALAETTSLINSSLDTDTVLNQVMDTVIKLTGAERGYIVLRNNETGEMEFRVARGIDSSMLAETDGDDGKKNEFIISSTVVNAVADSGEPVLTDNASLDQRFKSEVSIVGFGLRSILAVPMKVRNDVIGVVYCDNRILDGLFTERDRDILAAFANQAGVAIENAQLFEEARIQLNQLTQMRDMMRGIFDSIVNAVITVDTNGMILTVNDAARTILGAEDPVNKNVADAFPEMSDTFYSTLDEVLAGGEQKMLPEEPVLPGKGRRHWNVVISALRDPMGIVHGLVMVLDDQTEQKLGAAQLVEVRRYLPPALIDSVRGMENLDVEGQERTITMIATDVRGFTSFSELLQPEELMETINKYLSLASDAINLYEGIVDKYMGDAVTGLFNTQINPQEDHAVRAVRAALSIIYDLYALHEVVPEDERLYYGIGIHTGQAFLGNVGGADRKEFSALGEAATISKILESNAGPGEIIISEATYELVKDYFECEERTPTNTKGHDEIQTIYRVLKRKKGARTGALFFDPELAELLGDLDLDNGGEA